MEAVYRVGKKFVPVFPFRVMENPNELFDQPNRPEGADGKGVSSCGAGAGIPEDADRALWACRGHPVGVEV